MITTGAAADAEAREPCVGNTTVGSTTGLMASQRVGLDVRWARNAFKRVRQLTVFSQIH
jgi:hypothetical protein